MSKNVSNHNNNLQPIDEINIFFEFWPNLKKQNENYLNTGHQMVLRESTGTFWVPANERSVRVWRAWRHRNRIKCIEARI